VAERVRTDAGPLERRHGLGGESAIVLEEKADPRPSELLAAMVREQGRRGRQRAHGLGQMMEVAARDWSTFAGLEWARPRDGRGGERWARAHDRERC